MERLSPQTEREHRDFYAKVCSHLTRLEIMEALGLMTTIHSLGTKPDQEFFKLCALLCAEKDVEFRTTMENVKLQHNQYSSNLETALGFVGIQPVTQNPVLAASLEIQRGATPSSRVGAKMVAITSNTLTPFYYDTMMDHVANVRSDETVHSGNGLGITSRLGNIGLNVEYYVEEYFDHD